jgi:hypothetical protein
MDTTMKTFRNFAYATGLLMMVPVPGLPSNPPPSDSRELVATASNTFSDVGYLCARQQKLCEVAANLAIRAEATARNNFNVIYSWATETVEYKIISTSGDLAVLLVKPRLSIGASQTLSE